MEYLLQIGTPTTCPVIVFIRNGKIMTGFRHYQSATRPTISVWTIPGGRCDPGETIEQTLRREVAEEVGLHTFTIDSFLGIVAGSHADDQVYVFAGTTQEDPVLMEPEKFSEWSWMSFSELPENATQSPVFMLVQDYLEKLKTTP